MQREVQQAFLREDPEGFAQRHAADARAKNEFALDQPGAGLELAVQDFCPQPGGKAVGQAVGPGEGCCRGNIG